MGFIKTAAARLRANEGRRACGGRRTMAASPARRSGASPGRPLVAVLVLVSVALFMPGPTGRDAHAGSRSRKAARIIKKHVKARGGLKNIQAVDNMKVTGYLEAGGFQADLTLWMQRPNRSRMDIRIREMSIIQAYDGETAWWLNPLAGASEPTRMPAVFARAVIRWTEFDGPLVNYKKKRHRVEYAGAHELDDGRTAYKIKLIRADGEVWHLFIDSETHLEVMRTYQQTFEGRTMEVATYFSNFVEVGGLMTPHVVEGVAGEGSPYRLVFETFELGTKVDKSFFTIAGSRDNED